MKQDKFLRVLLCILLVSHLRYTLHANMNNRISLFSRYEKKKDMFCQVSLFSIISSTTSNATGLWKKADIDFTKVFIKSLF